MNLNEQTNRIKQMMGVINEVTNNIIDNNIKDPRLSSLLKKIETQTGKVFTQQHFDNEKKLSGDVKKESGGLDPNALKAFGQLQNACKGVTYDEDSYRTYEKQTDFFIEYIKKYGSIEGAMKLRSIPGFSQHHTGKAFDIEQIGPLRDCVGKNANKFGFIFPYTKNGIRVAEPWHIYYNI